MAINKVKKETFGRPDRQILFHTHPSDAVGVVVSAAAGVADDETGKKIVKAGTPLAGDLTDRTTPFTQDGASAVGVLLHDVDVTEGDENGSLVIFGFVDLNKLDEDVVTLVTAAKDALDGKVWFLK